ncbi:S-methyl-5'-thioadenosine phosphorylase isoform X1 [Dermacentor albipictus]|uniref:S-methyl-5'-thioadenosine phosphorylase isoform X1 n=1 Tax=Dermacentor albipictus TaxID=60249 RepID=UPI0031FD3B34
MAEAQKAIKVGIIGGSGLDNPDILEDRKEYAVSTPFGEPSDVLICGRIGKVDCVLLARHGRKHTLMPSKVNYRANIWALKELGCTHVIAFTACGSLREEMKPGDIVILDQFIDRTTKRETTFYDGSKDSPEGVCHISAAFPFHAGLREVLIKTVRSLNVPHHETGTVVTIEGPRFSTRVESCLFRSWNGHVINMTTVPEVILAKEAGLLYASIGLVTDYDSWRLDVQHVDVEAVLETMRKNSSVAIKVLLAVLPRVAAIDWSAAIKEAKDIVAEAILKPVPLL